MLVACFVVVPFGRDRDGDLVPLEPIEAQDAAEAIGRAQSAAAQHGGAIAFSQAGDPNTGQFGDAVILVSYGDVDHGLLEE